MNRTLDLSQIKLNEPFTIETTLEERESIKAQFQFDDIESLTGTFLLEKSTFMVPCLLLKGEIDALVTIEDSTFEIKVPLELYLVEDEDDVEKFSFDDDVEVIENNIIDIGDTIAQYIYLFIVNLSEDEVEDEDEVVEEIVDLD